MRSVVVVSLLAAATFGACSQPLADKSGTGGTGGVGAVSGTGGAQSTCDALALQYSTAVQDAQACAVGAPDQCQQLLSPAVISCTCPVPANTAAPNMIKQAWQDAGCAAITSAPACASAPCRPCGSAFCAQDPLDTTGTKGYCAVAPAGTGGAGGGSSSDGGISDCNQLSQEYAAAIAAAMKCDVGASGQCAQQVPSFLSVCGWCPALVNDATELNQIHAAWTQAGCDKAVAVACPAIDCVLPNSGNCVATDGGGGTCVLNYGGPPLRK
jgi:hypothetical protein